MARQVDGRNPLGIQKSQRIYRLSSAFIPLKLTLEFQRQLRKNWCARSGAGLLDLDLIRFLGPFVIGAVVGIIFLKMDSAKRATRTEWSTSETEKREAVRLSVVSRDSVDNVGKSSDQATQLELPDSSRISEGPRDGNTVKDDGSDLSKCPCGLVLPEVSMWEHVMSTGHSSISSAANVKLAKIWELEEAMIEQTSPDCYKCGKPVQGLKRVGKTIYVTHVGCMNPAKPEEVREISGKTLEVLTKTASSRKSEKCPICWEPVSANDYVEVSSSTGNKTKFHDNCLN